jgi:hypothetical protein
MVRVRRGSAFEHQRRGDALAAFEYDALAGNDLRDRHSGGDHCTGFASGIAKVERDHAHATLHITPHTRHPAQPP